MRYSKAFKEKAVKEVLSKKETQSMTQIAKGLNISKATLYKWVNAAKSSSASDGIITLQDKLRMLNETYNMSDEEVNGYCREKGIFKHQLKEFEKDFLDEKVPENNSAKKALEDEKEKSKSLAKELRRKEKALAETATLLVLQKKFQALLEGEA